MKLQKYMSGAGICSRRKAEEYIGQGRVEVNGKTAHIGQVIDPEKDTVKFHNDIVKAQNDLVYYVFHKPRGIVTTCKSDEKQMGILDVVDIKERVFPIGRLDKETNGLIILTNDGRLSNYLIHPKYQHEKEYLVEVYGKITDRALDMMQSGIKIDLSRGSEHKKIYKTQPAAIERLSSSRFRITLKEGKNRQIRRMVKAVGSDIKRLSRVRIENIRLGKLAEGDWRPMSRKEKENLFERLKIKK
ncbi:pseudouridine synthase [Candidatus Gracilibacteria bacterium]|nr:MAG: pseudouridine synthase [Candidatus Gracilibacteria bacterium]